MTNRQMRTDGIKSDSVTMSTGGHHPSKRKGASRNLFLGSSIIFLGFLGGRAPWRLISDPDLPWSALP
jgi:hypothetical protein